MIEEIRKQLLKHRITMIGEKRLDNVLYCTEQIIKNNIPGDLMETGVWKGGACIFMRAILKEHGDNNRKVICADSFEGLPPNKHPNDINHGTDFSIMDHLKISLKDVQNNFRKFGLLDSQVGFLKGFFSQEMFKDIGPLSLLRLDGDMYESTMEVLNACYAKVSKDGYIIVDDYGHWPNCKDAVDDFRKQHNITTPLEWIDYTGVFWKKES